MSNTITGKEAVHGYGYCTADGSNNQDIPGESIYGKTLREVMCALIASNSFKTYGWSNEQYVDRAHHLTIEYIYQLNKFTHP